MLTSSLMAGAAAGAETWTRLTLPGFTLFTDGSPRQAADIREWALCVEALRRDVQGVMATDERLIVPAVVIVSAEKNAVRDAMGGALSEGAFMVFNQRRGHFIGLLQADNDASRRGLLLQATDWSLGGVHLPPRWLRVGLSEVYATMKVKGSQVIVGGTSPGPKRCSAEGCRFRSGRW